MEICGFNPVINNCSLIIILGSIPSKKSRDINFYYGNKTNRFWKILSSILDINLVNLSNNEKTNVLLSHHIALYDVYSSVEMNGYSSLDSNIKKVKFNDIFNLIKDTNIHTIYITSKKAYCDFVKHFEKEIKASKINVVSLPSPSSANRSVYKNDEELIDAWKKIIKI